MNAIREAASRLPGNWHQGSLYNHNTGAACGFGWVQNVLVETEGADILETSFTEWDILDQVALEQYPDRMDGPMRSFPAFNDHPDTTEDEVVAVMEKAAVRWDERL